MTYRFDDFLVDPGRRELTHAGQPVAVEPQVFSLLVHLLDNRDRVVSKQELIEAIWDGRFVSDSAISSRIKSARKALGDDGASQRYIKTVHRHGFRFIGDTVVEVDGEDPRLAAGQASGQIVQDIRFCLSADGTKIAYATAGTGTPLLMSPCCFSHLEQDWQSPCWGHLHDSLLQGHQLVRYDIRANGLSDWDVTDYCFERHIEDMEAVADALGVEKIPLVGFAQGATVCAAFAAKYPERVSKLILLEGYTRGWRVNDDEQYKTVFEAFVTLVRAGWGLHSPPFRQMFTSLFMPKAPTENQDWFNELQRVSAPPENRAALFEAFGDVDVCDYLEDVSVPTLVVHCKGDMCVPVHCGRELAAGINNARFRLVDSVNHMIPESDPGWRQYSDAIGDFLAD